MVAPPRRAHVLHATLGMSPAWLSVRAIGGPVLNRASLDDVLEPFVDALDSLMVHHRWPFAPSPSVVVFLLVVVTTCVWGLAIVLMVSPGRDVTQASPRWFNHLALFLPGTAPSWSWAAGPVLLASSYVVLQALAIGLFGTAGVITASSASLVGMYRVPWDRAAAIAFGDPSWWVVGGALAALWGANAILIWRSNRARGL